MATASIKIFFKGVTNTDLEPLSYSTNDEFKFISYPKQTTNQEENAKFLTELDNSIKQYDEKSARCNEQIIAAQAKYPFLNNHSKEEERTNLEEEKNDITPTREPQEEATINKPELPKSKSFFSSFSSPLNKIYDFGAKSFGIIKNATSILSSKVTETFNFVNNKVLSYLSVGIISDDQLVEEIINTPEEELDAIFEKMTYEKLAELINNAPNEKAQKLVKHLMPEHIEELMKFIPLDKLNTYIDSTFSLDELIEQELKKLSDENISYEQLENIIILAGEERLVEKLDIIPDENLERIISSIPNDKLATIIDHASDENLERIFGIIDSDEHNLSESLVGQIITLIHDKKCIQQEVEQYNTDFNIKLSGESDNESGIYSDFEDDDAVYV